jgi:hypothetical protein
MDRYSNYLIKYKIKLFEGLFKGCDGGGSGSGGGNGNGFEFSCWNICS